MVGGIVKEVLHKSDRFWVNVRGMPDSCEARDECAIYIEATPAAERVKPGDSIWWQARNAYWTPQNYRGPRRGGKTDGLGTLWDIAIPRIGYSGVSHPAQALIEGAYSGQE